LSEDLGTDMATVGHYRLRIPIKPLPLVELAELGHADRDSMPPGMDPVDGDASPRTGREGIVSKPAGMGIGGGLQGCSTALHLARRGMKPILLEKNTVGRHASGVNAGGVRVLMRDTAEVPLSMAAMDTWFRLDELLGPELAANCHFIGGVGQVGVAESAQEMAWCEERVAQMKALGYDHEELIDPQEVKRLVPAITDICRGGIVSR